MPPSLVDNCPHMIVRQRIENGLSLPSALHQLALFQDAELMGYGRLGHVQSLRQIADADLRLKEHKEDPDSCGISENLEELRQIVGFRLLRHFFLNDF